MDTKITKLTKINSSRVLENFDNNNLGIHDFGISKKYTGEEVSVCLLGSGLPCHDNLPKFSIFETFTEDKEPIIDTNNFSTMGAGLLSSEHFGLSQDIDLIFARVIDNKGQIFLSSIISGILWSIIKETHIVVCPSSIPNEVLDDVKPLLKKLNERNMMMIFPIDKEENLDILKIDGVLGIKTLSNKENIWKIEKEDNNLINIFVPKNQKMHSTYGIDKYIKLSNKEAGLFIGASILSCLYCRHNKKNLAITNKVIYSDLENMKKEGYSAKE